MKKNKICMLLMLGFMPLLTGCLQAIPASVGLAYGSALWWDIAFIPFRSALGNATLNFINGV